MSDIKQKNDMEAAVVKIFEAADENMRRAQSSDSVAAVTPSDEVKSPENAKSHNALMQRFSKIFVPIDSEVPTDITSKNTTAINSESDSVTQPTDTQIDPEQQTFKLAEKSGFSDLEAREFAYDELVKIAEVLIQKDIFPNDRRMPTWGDTIWQNIPHSKQSFIRFFYQSYNILMVTGLLTFVWEKNPDFNPVKRWDHFVAIFLPMIIQSGFMLSMTNSFIPPEENEEAFKKTLQESEAKMEGVIKDINNLNDQYPGFKLGEVLYGLLTSPSSGYKWLQEFSMLSALATVALMDAAVIREAVKNLPAEMATAIGLGLVGPLDDNGPPFSAVSLNHWIISNKVPLPYFKDTAYFLNKVLGALGPLYKSTAPFVVSMILRWKPANDLPDMLFGKGASLPGGMLGYKIITAISAMVYGLVFSLYSYDKVISLFQKSPLVEEKEPGYLKRFFHAFSAALPLTIMAAYIADQNEIDPKKIGFLSAGTQFVMPALAAISPSVLNALMYLVEFRFMAPALRQLNRLQTLDKAALFVLSVAGAATGMIYDIEPLAATGQVLSFISASLLLGSFSPSALSFGMLLPADGLYYMASLINWVINTVLPINNLAHHRELKSHAELLISDTGHLNKTAQIGIVVFMALVSLVLVVGDYVSLVQSLIHEIFGVSNQSTDSAINGIGASELLSRHAENNLEQNLSGASSTKPVESSLPTENKEFPKPFEFGIVSGAGQCVSSFWKCVTCDEESGSDVEKQSINGGRRSADNALGTGEEEMGYGGATNS